MQFALNVPVETAEPIVTVDPPLAIGEHQFRLVVKDDSDNLSDPIEVTVSVRRQQPLGAGGIRHQPPFTLRLPEVGVVAQPAQPVFVAPQPVAAVVVVPPPPNRLINANISPGIRLVRPHP
jgi:hypothetical protein